MVFSGLYPVDGDDYPELRDALDKLRLNDASLVYEPETSTALGFGFRCGFLGLLHMEIVRERLEREFDLSLISTAPNVVYRVVMEAGAEIVVTNPSEFPGGPTGIATSTGVIAAGKIGAVFEPVVRATVLAPAEYIGAIMELCQSRRGALLGMDYLSEDRVEIRYTMPLGEIIFDFFDQLKSRTRGYASLDYEPAGEQEADLVKVDILLQGQPVDAFSQIVHADKAREYGLAMTAKLKELIPRQQFEVPIQAAIGPGSSPARTSGRCARTCSPSATAATSPASASCWRSRRRARADEDHRPGRGAAGGLRRGAVHRAGT